MEEHVFAAVFLFVCFFVVFFVVCFVIIFSCIVLRLYFKIQSIETEMDGCWSK